MLTKLRIPTLEELLWAARKAVGAAGTVAAVLGLALYCTILIK